MSVHIHEQVTLPDSKARTGIYKIPLELTSSRMNRCPGQQRGVIKEFSWGRHLPCLQPFYPSGSDYKASETQILETQVFPIGNETTNITSGLLFNGDDQTVHR